MTREPLVGARRRQGCLLSFFILSYTVSWAFWFPAVLASLNWIAPVPSRYLHLAGGLGPMLAAVVITSRVEGRGGLARLARRCTTGAVWMVIAVLIPAGLFFIATAVLAASDGASIEWRQIGRSTEFPELPRAVYWLANVVFYGFGEEVGWRGFALPRLQSHKSALGASVMLAFGWAGWHLPLFFFSPGLSSLGVAGVAGWVASLVVGSILLTWLFNSSGGSVGAVALLHASLDIFITSPVAPALPNVMGALLTMSTLLLIPAFGRRDLSWRPRATDSAGCHDSSALRAPFVS